MLNFIFAGIMIDEPISLKAFIPNYRNDDPFTINNVIETAFNSLANPMLQIVWIC